MYELLFCIHIIMHVSGGAVHAFYMNATVTMLTKLGQTGKTPQERK